MVMRDLTFSDVESLEALSADAADIAFEMDEESFRAFYDRTSRVLWAYLAKVSGSPSAADDLLQETYYRFLRARGTWESEAHRRAYLFRIATNLIRDGHRRTRRTTTVELPDPDRNMASCSGVDLAERAVRRTDLRRAMDRLRPRDRALLWLAYAQGQAHAEIAGTLGVKTGSVKQLLFRARRKLAGLLRGQPARSNGGDTRENG
jgi:RNA polymerase sigma-70 factor, ECF subfamily